jgi:hypothetical protein
MKLTLQNIGFPVMAYEGIIADEGQFDEPRTKRLVNLFITETFDLKKVVD